MRFGSLILALVVLALVLRAQLAAGPAGPEVSEEVYDAILLYHATQSEPLACLDLIVHPDVVICPRVLEGRLVNQVLAPASAVERIEFNATHRRPRP